MPLYSLSANQIEKHKNQPLVLQKAIDMVKSSLAGHYSHSSHSSSVLTARIAHIGITSATPWLSAKLVDLLI